MSRSPESLTAMTEVARGASLTDGRQTTQRWLTGNEPGNALEKRDGNLKGEAGLIRPFFVIRSLSDFLLEVS